MISVLNTSKPRPTSEAVFLPFDPFNVPFLGGLQIQLPSGRNKGIVVDRGDEGSVDHFQLDYYGGGAVERQRHLAGRERASAPLHQYGRFTCFGCKTLLHLCSRYCGGHIGAYSLMDPSSTPFMK